MGIKGSNLFWFKNCLSDRRQYVSIGGSSSEMVRTNCGVPQGSILGPLLFLLYINDLPLCSDFLTLLFADDTTLLLSGPDVNNLIFRVNQELRKVQNFFRFHKLALHPAKTKFIIFSNNVVVKKLDAGIFLNSNNDSENDLSKIIPLQQVKPSDDLPAIRFLGLYFDPNLNFDYHVSLISSKLSKALFMLRSAKKTLSQHSLKSIYYSLFHSHLVYCLPIWSATSKSNIEKIFKLQKQAIRAIKNLSYNDHTEHHFKDLKILPVNELIQYFGLQIMYCFVNNL